MKLNPNEYTPRPIFELPKFEFETVAIDLQHLQSGDAIKDGKEAEELVESFVNMRRQKYVAEKKAMVNFYPNLHPGLPVCFLTFVLLPLDKMQLKRRPIPV